MKAINVVLSLLFALSYAKNDWEYGTTTFSYEGIRGCIPEWSALAPTFPVIVEVATAKSVFEIYYAYGVIPTNPLKSISDFVKSSNGSIDEINYLDGNPLNNIQLVYSTPGFRSIAQFTYCNGSSYASIITTAANYTEMYPYMLNVTSCLKCTIDFTFALSNYPNVPAPATVVTPKYYNYAYYAEAVQLAKSNSAQLLHTYVDWGGTETQKQSFDWTFLDVEIGIPVLEGFNLSIVISVISTAVKGTFPPDLTNSAWNNSVFMQRLVNFTDTLLARYNTNGNIKYIQIGNEINVYFASHKSEMDAYKTLVNYVQNHITNIPIGCIFSYHDAVSANSSELIDYYVHSLDMVFYTFYLYSDSGPSFNLDPHTLGTYYSQMISVAQGKKIGIVELGWNTNSTVGGSQENQAIFIQEAYSLLLNKPENVAFLSWFSMYDLVYENCYQLVQNLYPGVNITKYPALLKSVDLLCYFGLRTSDDIPKLGWNTWVQETNNYIAMATSPQSTSSTAGSTGTTTTSTTGNTSSGNVLQLKLFVVLLMIFINL